MSVGIWFVELDRFFLPLAFSVMSASFLICKGKFLEESICEQLATFLLRILIFCPTERRLRFMFSNVTCWASAKPDMSKLSLIHVHFFSSQSSHISRTAPAPPLRVVIKLLQQLGSVMGVVWYCKREVDAIKAFNIINVITNNGPMLHWDVVFLH